MKEGVSKLVLGTVQFGLDYGINNPKGKPSLQDSFSILSFAQSNGIETLDTAEGYGNALEVIGNYHLSKPAFKVISKFSSGETIAEKCNSTLNTLGIPSYEAYLFHSFNNFFQTQEKVIPTLLQLKKENKIKKIGVSVYTNEELQAVIDSPEVDLIQLPFNLLDNLSKRGDLLRKAKVAGKEIHTRSVFLQGLFFMKNDLIPQKLKPLSAYLDEIKSISQSNGISIQSLSLNYSLSCPLIDKVLIGVDSLEQLKQNITLVNNEIAPPIFDKINMIDVKEIELLNPVNWK